MLYIQYLFDIYSFYFLRINYVQINFIQISFSFYLFQIKNMILKYITGHQIMIDFFRLIWNNFLNYYLNNTSFVLIYYKTYCHDIRVPAKNKLVAKVERHGWMKKGNNCRPKWYESAIRRTGFSLAYKLNLRWAEYVR